MSNRFDNSTKRINRAKLHLAETVKQWNAVMNPDKYETVFERRGLYQIVAKAVVEVALSNDIDLELGEYFYQLRAALDGMFWEASILQGGSDPPPHETRVAFPLYEKESDFKNSTAWKGSFSPKLKQWLEAIQPYNIDASAEPNLKMLCGRLKTLHDCARKDRHRRLHSVAAIPKQFSFEFQVPPNVLLTDITPLPCNFLNNEFYFLAFTARVTDGTAPELRFKSALMIEIRVDELSGLVGRELGDELENIILAVREVIEVFKAEYPT